MRLLLKIALPLLLACSAIADAPWDGVKGDLRLVTFSSAPGQTTFTVTSTNFGVTAIRFRVVFSDGDLSAVITKTVDMVPALTARRGGSNVASSVSFIIPVEQSKIAGAPQITELFDGPLMEF